MDIDILLDKAKLSLKWWDSILIFILTNKLAAPRSPFLIHSIKDVFQRDRLFIEIFGDTTKKDVIRAFRLVSKRLQKHLLGKDQKGTRIKPKFERDKLISIKYKKGLSEHKIYNGLPEDEIINPETLRKAKGRFKKNTGQ